MRDQPGFRCPTLLLLIFFAIGLAAYLNGCNSAVQNQCTYWTPFSGTIYKTELVNETCSTCISVATVEHRRLSKRKRHKQQEVCVEYANYTCYSSYVWAIRNVNDTSDQTHNLCGMRLTHQVNLFDNAQASIQGWAVGKQIVWYRDKSTDLCMVGWDLEFNWYTGVVFLCLMIFPLHYLYMSRMARLEMYRSHKYTSQKQVFPEPKVEPKVEVVEVVQVV